MVSIFTSLNISSPDPDQRLTTEVQDLAESLASIWGSLITPTVDIAWFTWMLSRLVGTKGMYPVAGYMVGLLLALRILVPNREQMEKREKELESNFRFTHSRLTKHCESVAFFGGDAKEKAIADDALANVLEQQRTVRRASRWYDFVFSCLNRSGEDVGVSLNVPMLLTNYMELTVASSGTGEGAAMAASAEYLHSVTERVINSFGKLTRLYETINILLSSAGRVVEMLDVLNVLEKSGLDSASTSMTTSVGSIALENADLVTPTGVCLAKGLSLELKKGRDKGLVVTGPVSAGKTGLFRLLAGLWPLRTGTLTFPPPGEVLLVPQRCYCPEGTLGDQITYPQRLGKPTAEEEARLVDCLEKVGIGYLAKREKGLSSRSTRWDQTLSLGEQQRLQIARVVWHLPAFAVLDEATDAVSQDVEEDLYATLARLGTTIITISKRLTLAEFHSSRLSLGEPTSSGWALESTNAEQGQD